MLQAIDLAHNQAQQEKGYSNDSNRRSYPPRNNQQQQRNRNNGDRDRDRDKGKNRNENEDDRKRDCKKCNKRVKDAYHDYGCPDLPTEELRKQINYLVKKQKTSPKDTRQSPEGRYGRRS